MIIWQRERENVVFYFYQSQLWSKKMRLETKMRGKSVNIYNNGDLWVAGKNTGLRQWSSDSKRWSKQSSGSEISELRGKSLEQVLQIRGYIWCSRIREWFYRNIWFIPFGRIEARSSLFFYPHFFLAHSSSTSILSIENFVLFSAHWTRIQTGMSPTGDRSRKSFRSRRSSLVQ